MKRFLSILLAVVFAEVIFAQDNKESESEVSYEKILAAADSAYINGDYSGAANLYEKIIRENGVSPSLYMNLGNSYFKKNEIAKSILNYERAYKLDPSDEDIRFNLELARTKTVDEEIVKNELFIFVWIRKFVSLMNVNQWGYAIIFFVFLLVIALATYFFTKKTVVLKAALIVSTISAILTIASFFAASYQKKLYMSHNYAIVMAPSATVKSTPNETGTDLFIIHEGRKVEIIDSTMKNWVEIKLDDGNEGWIQNDIIDII